MHGAIPPLPQCVFMVWCIVKHWDNLLYFYNLVFVIVIVSSLILYKTKTCSYVYGLSPYKISMFRLLSPPSRKLNIQFA